jgi:hypothetical protein
VPERPVMIHLGEAQVLERKVPKLVQRLIDAHITAADLLEKRPQMLFVHV